MLDSENTEINERINQANMEYITFDPYYNVNEYNNFITAAKNNKVPFEEFVRIKPPHNRYLMINPKDLPKFVNYDIATKPDKTWLVSVVKPVQNNEAYYLKRRPGQDISYFNYILPEPLKNMHEENYVCVFRGYDQTEISQYSQRLGKGTKIFRWGKTDIKGYNVFVCFNRYIKGLVSSTRVLLEYDNMGINTKNKVPAHPGYIEQELNYKILVQEKLINKTFLLEYYEDGKRFPLTKTTFL